ncbi:MAG: hypothetical protein AAF266_15685 [Planctomycetota bacterium]
MDARIVDYFPSLKGHVAAGRDLLAVCLPAEHVEETKKMIAKLGGTTDLALDDTAREQANIPHVFEFCYNHTTLQALKVDKSVTYLQTLFPAPIDEAAIREVMEHFGDELLWHHEYVRFGGAMVAFAIQVVRYTSPERLRQIIAEIESRGLPVFDPHTYVIEDGGMKQVDPRHIAFKHIADPLGLMNPGKTRAWDGPNAWMADRA